MICASLSWFLAFNNSCLTPALVNSWLTSSLVSTDATPTRTGLPVLCISFTVLTTALNLPLSDEYIKSTWSSRITGLFVGIHTTFVL